MLVITRGYDEIVRGQGFESGSQACSRENFQSSCRKWKELFGWWVLKRLIDLDWRFGHWPDTWTWKIMKTQKTPSARGAKTYATACIHSTCTESSLVAKSSNNWPWWETPRPTGSKSTELAHLSTTYRHKNFPGVPMWASTKINETWDSLLTLTDQDQFQACLRLWAQWRSQNPWERWRSQWRKVIDIEASALAALAVQTWPSRRPEDQVHQGAEFASGRQGAYRWWRSPWRSEHSGNLSGFTIMLVDVCHQCAPSWTVMNTCLHKWDVCVCVLYYAQMGI